MVELPWAKQLEPEDWSFIKQFILTSGSLKEMAIYYDVTYPTLRLKLDRLIQKIQLTENAFEDDFITKIKQMVLSNQLDYNAAKVILSEYRRMKEK